MALTLPQGRIARVVLGVFALIAAFALLAFLVLDVLKVGSIALPPASSVSLTPLKQNWNEGWEVGESQWFHHADQGTRILNYDWFLALEQPELSVTSIAAPAGKFSDPAYLERFGFIPSHPDKTMNPDGLPVGLAVNRDFQEPYVDSPAPYPVVGLTCAACHTGQINYKGKSLRIDGGSGMVDLGKFKAALGRAVLYTKYVPGRFDRFARKVLKDRYGAETKAKLGEEIDAFLAKGKAERDYAEHNHLYATEAGYSRTDALGLILNRAFGQLDQENLSAADAPVNFPHIWDAPWFDWVQYNASIRTPMARNIGEVLGVGGLVSLPGANDSEEHDWHSTVNVENLHLMEQQLAGDEPFTGLSSPKWPEDVFGKLDADLVARGKELYVSLKCSGCHWRMEDIQAAYQTEDGLSRPDLIPMWTAPNRYAQRFLNTAGSFKNLEFIGTDPGAAMNFSRRTVVVAAGRDSGSAGSNLDFVTNRIREIEYKKLGLLNDDLTTDDDKQQLKRDYDGQRVPWEEFLYETVSQTAPEGEGDERTIFDLVNQIDSQRDSAIRLGYKARPLNGIWATPPYLHNGSVRTLYQIVSPVAERETTIHLGSKEFDPVEVGYLNQPITGGFALDTSLPGNGNTGHEYRNLRPGEKGRVKGVLGPEIPPEDRKALVEYLKSL